MPVIVESDVSDRGLLVWLFYLWLLRGLVNIDVVGLDRARLGAEWDILLLFPLFRVFRLSVCYRLTVRQ